MAADQSISKKKGTLMWALRTFLVLLKWSGFKAEQLMTSARSLSSHTYNEGQEESERLYSDVTWPHIRLRCRHEHTHSEEEAVSRKKEKNSEWCDHLKVFLNESVCPLFLYFLSPFSKVLSWFLPGCLQRKTFFFLSSKRSQWMDGDE